MRGSEMNFKIWPMRFLVLHDENGDPCIINMEEVCSIKRYKSYDDGSLVFLKDERSAMFVKENVEEILSMASNDTKPWDNQCCIL